MRIRSGEERDLPALADIFSRSATDLMERYRPSQIGQLTLEPGARLQLYGHLLKTGAVFVADASEPVGYAAAVMRDNVWFLSQLWVLPERQGSGIGSALFDEALAWGSGATTFSVVSSPHPGAQLLYLRASMYPLWAQNDLAGGHTEVPAMPEGVEPLTEADQGWVDDLDREIRGTARPEDHSFWRAADVRGVALRRDREPLGYVYTWPDGKVGPAATREPRDMTVLLAAARHQASGPITVAVPSTNWTALRELVRAGLAPVGSNTFLASRPLGDATRYISSGGALG